MRGARRLSMVAVRWALLSSGCATSSATFVATDQRAVGRTPTQPPVYIDRLPPLPFFSVGVIEVHVPAGMGLDYVVYQAHLKGGEVGCDVVVDRFLYRASYGVLGARVVVAQLSAFPMRNATPPPPVVTPVAPAPINYASPPPDRHEFICGVAYPTVPPPPAPTRAPAPSAGAAPPADRHMATVESSTDVRSAPSTAAPRIGGLMAGQTVSVLTELRNGWWVVFLEGGRVGYVPERAIRLPERK